MVFLTYLYLFITILAVITVTITIVLVVRSHGINGSQYFATAHVFLLLYLLLFVNSAVAADPTIRYFSLLLRLAALSLASLFNILYATSFTGSQVGVRQLVILSLVAAATVLFIMTDPAHHLVVASLLIPEEPIAVFESARFGPGYVVYGMLSLVGCFIPAALFLRFAHTHRGRQAQQARILGIANIMIIVPYVLYGISLGLLARTLPPPLPIILVVTSVFVVVILYQRRLLDVLPRAFSSMIQQLDNPILICDSSGSLVHLNPYAESLFALAGIVVGRSTLDEIPNVPATWRSLKPGGKLTFDVDVDCPSSIDCPRSFTFTVSAVHDRQARPIGYTIIGYDITESRLSTQRQLLLEAERARSEFLSTFIPVISHELRTPLTAINMATYIAERSPDNGLRQEKLREVVSNSMRIARILSEIQELINLDNPKTDSVQLVDFSQVLRMLPEGISGLIERAGLRYQVTVEAERTTVLGNRRLLLRALYSLIDNAVRYSPPNGTIAITVRQRADLLTIAVQDSGPGIATEALPFLFEPFYKANSARTSDGSGLGLGLPLADRIVRRHGGSIEVVSTPGQGSTFILILPLHSLTVSDHTTDGPLSR